jgi:hypothetical protein
VMRVNLTAHSMALSSDLEFQNPNGIQTFART